MDYPFLKVLVLFLKSKTENAAQNPGRPLSINDDVCKY